MLRKLTKAQEDNKNLEKSIKIKNKQCNELEIDNNSLKRSIEMLKDNIKIHGEFDELLFKKDEIIKAHLLEIEAIKSLLDQSKNSYNRKEKGFTDKISSLYNKITAINKDKDQLDSDKIRNIAFDNRIN